MFSKFRIMTAFALSTLIMVSVAVAAESAPTPSAQVVLDRTLTALGGRENLAAVTSLSMVGAGVAYDNKATFELAAMAPNKKKIKISTPFYQVTRSFDGVLAWETQGWEGMKPRAEPYTREVASELQARVAREALLNPLVTYAQINTPVELIATPADDETGDFILEFHPDGERPHRFYIDGATYLPRKDIFSAPYEDGEKEITASYEDYRSVGAIKLPFKIVEMPLHRARPIVINVEKYTLNPKIADSVFAYPYASKRDAPYSVSLSTSPSGVYKEADWLRPLEEGWDTNPRWGVAFAPTETWTFDLVVNEKYGRWLEPVDAVVEFYSGEKKVKVTDFSGEALSKIRRLIVTRYGAIPATFAFRHHFTETADLEIDRMTYTLNLRDANGKIVNVTQSFPVERYQQKNKLIFPIKGKFLIWDAHNYNEINHKDEVGQWGAYDIIGLGPKYEMLDDDDGVNDRFVTYRIEVVAPADGVVYFARNDVPDDWPEGVSSREQFDEWVGNLPDPMWAMPGNAVVIDHGDGEFSFFAHLSGGSVRVKKGDKVKQGQVVGLLGAAQTRGSPHLHYQLQNGPMIFRSEGLPSRFENLVDQFGGKVTYPKYGFYLEAQ